MHIELNDVCNVQKCFLTTFKTTTSENDCCSFHLHLGCRLSVTI